MKNTQIRYTAITLISIIFISIFFSSCKKDDDFFNTSVDLEFSTDTIIFDTVFTTLGSTTAWLKITNPENKSILIDRIWLAGGSESNYRINVDGKPGVESKNIEIAPNDSLYVFVEVTVDPNNSNTPLIVADSIMFQNKNNLQKVDLVAWGQDAHFIVPDRKIGSINYNIVAGEGENITWTNDKPYVVYGYAVVDSAGVLNIDKGVTIHFHQGSGLWIYKDGNIQVNGTKDEPVTFCGDRLESYYDDIPGQWDRIWINESTKDHVFNYAVIKNGFIGIQSEILFWGQGNSGKLILNNCQISNMTGRGIFAKAYDIQATNLLVSNTAEISVYLSAGGNYDFRHCTFANYWPYGNRQTPALVASNFYEDLAAQTAYSGNLNAYFGNSVIYGSNLEEFIEADKYGGMIDYTFENCLIKTSINPADHPSIYLNCLTRNSDLPSYDPNEPIFKDYYEGDFRPDSLSPMVDYGIMSVINNSPVTPASIIQNDYNGNDRTSDLGPDIGLFEFVPGS